MKSAYNFLETEERPICVIFWNNTPFKILGGLTLKINEDLYDISTNLQKVFSDTTEKSLKK